MPQTPRARKISDTPMSPSDVDKEIARHKGTSASIALTPARLLAAKLAPPPTPHQRIHELTAENGNLRLEIRYYRSVQESFKDLTKNSIAGADKIKVAVAEFYAALEAAENDWYEAMGTRMFDDVGAFPGLRR